MKILIRIILVTFIYVGLATTCEKDEVGIQNTSATEIRDIAKSGSWKISYFFDSDKNETHHFTGYLFSFNEDGSLVARKGDTTVTGTWSVTQSSSSDDDGGSNDLDFNIFFASPREFEELSDDWDVDYINNYQIELIDVSGGNGGIDSLHFDKI